MPTQSQEKQFIDLVDKIIAEKNVGNDTTALENEIDRLVYALYDLTQEEIDIIEGHNTHQGNPVSHTKKGSLWLVKDKTKGSIDIDSIEFRVTHSQLPYKSTSYYLESNRSWLIVGDGQIRNPTQADWNRLYNIIRSNFEFTGLSNPLINDGNTIEIDITINGYTLKQYGKPKEGAEKILAWLDSIPDSNVIS